VVVRLQKMSLSNLTVLGDVPIDQSRQMRLES
jgi:hypothetical protein